MQITGIEKLNARDIRIVPRTAMAYSAKFLEMDVRYRRFSTFVFVMRGNYRYTWEGGELTVGDGEIVYIPRGTYYHYSVRNSDRFACQVEFDTFVGEENCVFGKCPMKFPLTPDARTAMLDITGGCDEYSMLAGIYTVFGSFARDQRSERGSRAFAQISPAVEFLRNHYAEDVTSEELAAMCFLSVSQMRRLFSAEFGMAPLEFRTAERIKAAAGLLSGSYESISTVAAAVGYESQFAFSKAFRRLYGLSPSEYAAKFHVRHEQG